ncbi:MAG: tetratricopeptide repeat protein, partial [Alphaproteobacteria bacterium]|nr:tetratricopeptide repeat protein [Alphaproteobacteria bacterium]
MRPVFATDPRRAMAPTLLLVAALALGACQSRNAGLETDPMATGSTSPAGPLAGTGGQPATGSFRRTELLAQQFSADPSNVKVGLDYAKNLEEMGQTDQQVSVLKSVAVAHPNDGALQAQLGKQLLKMGRVGESIAMLERSAAQPGADWKTLSALGTAYDQQGNYQQARAKYQAALALKPNQLSVENNLGMSYAMEGKLPDAEKILRAASAQPGADAEPRVRQNLALVVGLQGR